MCGIIGYIGSKQVVPVLVDGLRRLGLPLDDGPFFDTLRVDVPVDRVNEIAARAAALGRSDSGGQRERGARRRVQNFTAGLSYSRDADAAVACTRHVRLPCDDGRANEPPLDDPAAIRHGRELDATARMVLLVFGAAQNGFNATIRVFCYAYSPMAFGVVPVLGHVVGTIWMVVIAIIGLREAHRTETWRATVAVLLPFFLFIAFIVTAVLFLLAAGAALLTL